MQFMSEEAKPEVEDTQPRRETPATEPESPSTPPSEPSPPGRLARWIGAALRWGAGFGVVFALGVALAWFLRVRPQTQDLRLLGQHLQETQQQLATAQADAAKLQPLQNENSDLKDQVAQSEQHLALLSVLVDVTSSQLALAEDDPLAAQSALRKTDSKLATIQDGVDADSAKTVKSMRDRLGTTFDELNSDNLFAAKRDLEVMANTLVDLEGALFPGSSP
jgi:hypothetical protein